MNDQTERPTEGGSSPLDPQWLAGRGRLAQSIRLEEKGPSRFAALSICLLTLTVAGFVVWAWLTPIVEITPASGEVIPAGMVNRVQHLEGGIVASLSALDGDVVQENQVLMELESGSSAPELEQQRTRLAGLRLQETQLRAMSSGKDADLQSKDERFGGLVAAQIELLRNKRAALERQADVLKDQLEEYQAENSKKTNQVAHMKEQIAILEEQIKVRSALLKKGYASRMRVLDQQRELARVKGQLAELQGDIGRLSESIEGARSKIAELHATSQLEASREMGKVQNEIAEMQAAIARAQDRVTRLTIRAPVRGIVKGLQTETVGGVIAPGSTILEIVPLDATLIVAARVMPQDIGFVHKGQPAFIKVATYDYTRFGGIDGTINTISATTFLDDNGHPYYRARIRLAKNYVGTDPTRNLVIPGMTVMADIQTGEKTVLAYLLKPLASTANEALRER